MSAVETLARECAEVYTTPEQRAAYRAGMSTAAMICDETAVELLGKTKASVEKHDVAKLCGDRITVVRERVSVR